MGQLNSKRRYKTRIKEVRYLLENEVKKENINIIKHKMIHKSYFKYSYYNSIHYFLLSSLWLKNDLFFSIYNSLINYIKVFENKKTHPYTKAILYVDRKRTTKYMLYNPFLDNKKELSKKLILKQVNIGNMNIIEVVITIRNHLCISKDGYNNLSNLYRRLIVDCILN